MNDLLIEVNVALWGFIVPMSGIFSFVRFKKGGPSDPEGKYISTGTAMVLLLATALFSHFVLSPIVRESVESLCLTSPYMGYALPFVAIIFIWILIKKSQEKE